MIRDGVRTNEYEAAAGIAVDEGGSVYVTGHTSGKKEDYDLMTIKYSPDGDLVWSNRYKGEKKNGNDRAVGLGIDDSGHVYVVGLSESKKSEKVRSYASTSSNLSRPEITGITFRLSDYDVVVLKYSKEGKELWTKTYAGPGGYYLKNDLAQAMAVLRDGNVVVAGMTNHPVRFARGETETKQTGSTPIFGGAIVESTTYTTPDLAIDDSGFFAFKLSSAGETVWNLPAEKDVSRQMQMVTGLTVGLDGSLYIIGTGQFPGTGFDYVVAKYSASGDSAWFVRYNGPRGVDAATAIAVDDSGYAYVTGESRGVGTGGDYGTIKYSPSGVVLWTQRYDGPAKARSIDSPVSIAISNDRQVYVTGASAGESIDIATIKYNSYGRLLWVQRYDGSGKGLDKASAMAIDQSGNIYVVGRSLGEESGYDFATIKYTPAGEIAWVRRFDGQKHGDDGPNALAVDAIGNVYVTGTSWSGKTHYDYLTIKYSPSGEELWNRTHNGSD
jgi:uncharacterized delta-60 repeat protein